MNKYLMQQEERENFSAEEVCLHSGASWWDDD
jgi:hypothetical protein